MRTGYNRVLAFLVTMASVAGLHQAIAGNGWNPPPKNPEDEKRLRQVGAEFFKLEGRIYSFLGALEEGSIKGAQEQIPVVKNQMDASATQCQVLSVWLRSSPDFPVLYEKSLKTFDKKTGDALANGILLHNEPTWASFAKTGPANIVGMCRETVEEISKSFENIAKTVRGGSMPSPVAVWRLMNTLETGSKRSRYFSIILRE